MKSRGGSQSHSHWCWAHVGLIHQTTKPSTLGCSCVHGSGCVRAPMACLIISVPTVCFMTVKDWRLMWAAVSTRAIVHKVGNSWRASAEVEPFVRGSCLSGELHTEAFELYKALVNGMKHKWQTIIFQLFGIFSLCNTPTRSQLYLAMSLLISPLPSFTLIAQVFLTHHIYY